MAATKQTQNSEKVSSQQRSDTQVSSWSIRIPAAIARMRAGGLPDGTKWLKWYGKDGGSKHETDIVTREEAVLAEALWEICVEETPADIERDFPALIAYTEKIERLSHD